MDRPRRLSSRVVEPTEAIPIHRATQPILPMRVPERFMKNANERKSLSKRRAKKKNEDVLEDSWSRTSINGGEENAEEGISIRRHAHIKWVTRGKATRESTGTAAAVFYYCRTPVLVEQPTAPRTILM